MTNDEAWTLLEDALSRCHQEGVQTEAVYQALKHLSSQARPVAGAKGVYFPFHNFWKCMEPPRPMEQEEGRSQQAIAAMRGMRLRVPAANVQPLARALSFEPISNQRAHSAKGPMLICWRIGPDRLIGDN
jgi:hypothetical protein